MKIRDVVSDAATRAKDIVENRIASTAWAIRKPVEVSARTVVKYAGNAVTDAGWTVLTSVVAPPLVPVAIACHLLDLPSVLKAQWQESAVETELAKLEREQTEDRQ